MIVCFLLSCLSHVTFVTFELTAASPIFSSKSLHPKKCVSFSRVFHIKMHQYTKYGIFNKKLVMNKIIGKKLVSQKHDIKKINLMGLNSFSFC